MPWCHARPMQEEQDVGGAHFEVEERSDPARALPAMEETMKQAKIMPCGMVSPRGDSGGVPFKTNV